MSVTTWQEWLAACVVRSKMEVDPVPLAEASGWESLNTEEGLLNKFVNSSGRFFEVIGLMIFGAGREVEGWGQAGIHEIPDPDDVFDYPRHGFLCHVFSLGPDGEINGILVQANKEPLSKTPGHVTLAPAIQASFSNLQHGRTPLSELLAEREDIGNVIKDPGRSDGVNNMGMIFRTMEERSSMELLENYRWFSIEELEEALSASVESMFAAPFNGHFWTAYGAAMAARSSSP